MSLLLLLLLLLLHGLIPLTQAVPPRPLVLCDSLGCNVSNAYGRWTDPTPCRASTIVYPRTEEEIRQAVATATRKNLKVKVVTGYGHSIPKLTCPSSPPENSMLISTAAYSSSIEVDPQNLRVTADSGVGIRDLIDRVEEAGLSLVASTYWEGASLGGVISTGSHGSSWWGKGGAVHEQVVGLSLVIPAGPSEGYAKIIRIDGGDPLFDAVRVSLGVVGVISKVTLSLELGFKRSITNSYKDDAHLEDEFMDIAQIYEFADIIWYPSQYQAVYRYDNRVPLNSLGDGKNDFIGFQSMPVPVYMAARATEEEMESERDVKGKCVMAASQVAYKELVANGLKNNVIFTGYPVVGRQGRMQTSGSCLHLSMCPWDPRIKGLRIYEASAIFPASKFRDFIQDVKMLRDLKPKNFCGLDIYTGFLIRFIKASQAYLGPSEDSVAVDFSFYQADKPLMPRLNQDVWEEVEQMAFFKYRAKPHWAKNRNLAFFGVEDKYPNFSKFIAVKQQLDPQGMFSSEWSDEILFGKGASKGDGCAMAGQCICSEDRHCSPGDQYFCKPGLVYKEARVCRYSP
ncbi:hypothetical protein MRB53_012415 [Persea americana]|uniref:Uncharacterized protein n=1 Tax=Persea americana TaxID=3435 RepID=A0ACC2LY76_PERAE|nr:hypothetical protein MRB53_012415 [Persea americana]